MTHNDDSSSGPARLTVCYFGTYRNQYARYKVLSGALKAADVEIKDCHAKLWHGIEDREKVAGGGWLSPVFWFRLIAAYLKLIFKFAKIGHYDVMLVGYPGQLDVFLARFLNWFRGNKPLVLDVLMSLYVVALEREIDKRSGFSVELLKKLENRSLRVPDLLIHDTPEYVAWLGETFGLSPQRFYLVPLSADQSVFTEPLKRELDAERFNILYYGTFIHNHGVDKIVRAAALLRDIKKVHFYMVGDGPERAKAERFVKEQGLDNVYFLGWKTQQELIEIMEKMNIALGPFGNTPQSMMTVQNKLYECMAMGLPLLIGESPATLRQFGRERLASLSERSPEAMAATIRGMIQVPEKLEAMATEARKEYEEKYALSVLGAGLRKELERLCKNIKIIRRRNRGLD